MDEEKILKKLITEELESCANLKPGTLLRVYICVQAKKKLQLF